MKALFITLLFSSSSLMLFSQTTTEKLKKDLSIILSENQKLKDENAFLREKLIFCNSLFKDTVTQIKSFDPNYEIHVVSCTGNRTAQTVTIELVLIHNLTNQEISIDVSKARGSQAVDIIGKTYEIKFKDNYMAVFTGVETRIILTIPNVMPGTEGLSLLSLRMNTKDVGKMNMNYEFTEIRNLKIVW